MRQMTKIVTGQVRASDLPAHVRFGLAETALPRAYVDTNVLGYYAGLHPVLGPSATARLNGAVPISSPRTVSRFLHRCSSCY
jgi:hypothetical protein